MPIRMKNNSDVLTRKHLLWTREYFIRNFGMFKGTTLLKLGSLRRRGVRGCLIWVVLWLYKCRMPGLFLFLYTLYTKVSRKDLKF